MPLSVQIGRKIFPITQNKIRTANRYDSASAKKKFGKLMAMELAVKRLKREEFGPPPYHFYYTIHPGSNHECDLDNFAAVVKFMNDVLVDGGYIEKDTTEFIKTITLEIGVIDKEYPRAELVVMPYVDYIKERRSEDGKSERIDTVPVV